VARYTIEPTPSTHTRPDRCGVVVEDSQTAAGIGARKPGRSRSCWDEDWEGVVFNPSRTTVGSMTFELVSRSTIRESISYVRLPATDSTASASC